jgi:hypothetical protein
MLSLQVQTGAEPAHLVTVFKTVAAVPKRPKKRGGSLNRYHHQSRFFLCWERRNTTAPAPLHLNTHKYPLK